MFKKKKKINFYKTNRENIEILDLVKNRKDIEFYSLGNDIYIKTLDTLNYEIITEKDYINSLYIDKKNKLGKHNINHYVKDDLFYRIIKFKNLSNSISIEELFNNKDIITLFSSSLDNDILKKIDIQIVEFDKKYENEKPFDFIEYKSETDKIKLKEIKESYYFDIKIILKAESLESLNEITNKFIETYRYEYNVFPYIETHTIDLFNITNYNRSFALFIDKEDNLYYLNSINLNNNSAKKVIPFEGILSNGIIKINEKEYSEIYKFENINYLYARDDEKEMLFEKYKKIITAYSKDVDIQLYLQNESMDSLEKEKDMFCKDNLPYDKNYIEWYNQYLNNNLKIAEVNSPEKNFYLIIKVNEKNDVIAKETLNRVIQPMMDSFKSMGSKLEKISIEEKINLFFYIYNFDFTNISKKKVVKPQGLLLKDFLAPSSLKYKPVNIQQGLTFKKSYLIKKYPSYLKDNFISDVMSLPFEISVSIHTEIEDIVKNIDLINSQIFRMEKNIIEKKEAQKKGKNGYINNDLQTSYHEAMQLREIIQKEDEKLFETSIVITILGKDKKDLDLKNDILQSAIKKHMFFLSLIPLKQQEGLFTNMPLGKDYLNRKRTLLTRNLACLTPFSMQEIYHPTGVFYGLSKTQKLLVVDRTKFQNPSGWFLGVSGSGKSFLAKKEMLSVAFRYPDDDILVIDPENEYSGMLKSLNGEIIDVSVSTNTYLNPLHITNDIERLCKVGDENPVNLKKESVMGFLECLLNTELTNAEKGHIDRILEMLYSQHIEEIKSLHKEYLEIINSFISELSTSDIDPSLKRELRIKMDSENQLYSENIKNIMINKDIDKFKSLFTQVYKNEDILSLFSLFEKNNEKIINIFEKIKTKKAPCLMNFFEVLEKESVEENNVIARSLKDDLYYYVRGSVNIFAKETNVNTNNKIVSFNIREMGTQIKSSALLIILEIMWERVLNNKAIGRRTWIYIDEIYLLFQHEATATWLMNFFKRVRKYGGVITGITQNCSDLLQSHQARVMLANSEFKVVLNQATEDREQLTALFGLSELQSEQITNSDTGEGILIASKYIIPLSDKFPLDNPLYKIMSTKLGDN